MKSAEARTARKGLDRRFNRLPPVSSMVRPPAGWIRAIRDALGMSGPDLAHRMGVSAATVSDIERSERDGTARLDTLKRAADALDCDLVYLLVPRRSLTATVEQRALNHVRGHVSAVARAMTLESQGTE